jgi:hypothetical protein
VEGCVSLRGEREGARAHEREKSRHDMLSACYHVVAAPSPEQRCVLTKKATAQHIQLLPQLVALPTTTVLALGVKAT